jgi:hypothetical protein
MRHMRHFRALFPGKSPARARPLDRHHARVWMNQQTRTSPRSPSASSAPESRPRSTAPHHLRAFSTRRSRTRELSREARPRNPDRASVVSGRRRSYSPGKAWRAGHLPEEKRRGADRVPAVDLCTAGGMRLRRARPGLEVHLLRHRQAALRAELDLGGHSARVPGFWVELQNPLSSRRRRA